MLMTTFGTVDRYGDVRQAFEDDHICTQAGRNRSLRIGTPCHYARRSQLQPPSVLTERERAPFGSTIERTQRLLHAAALTSIFFGCAAAGLATVTLSTPFLSDALMLSALTPGGS